MSEVFSSQQLEPVESVWQRAEWSRERTTTYNKQTQIVHKRTQMSDRNKPMRILCEKNLVGKPVEERESLQNFHLFLHLRQLQWTYIHLLRRRTVQNCF